MDSGSINTSSCGECPCTEDRISAFEASSISINPCAGLMQEAPPGHPHGSACFDCPQERLLAPTWQGLGLPGHPLGGASSAEPASCVGPVRLRNDVRCVSGLLGLPRAPGSGMPGPRVTSQSGATERPAAGGPSGGTQLLRARHVPLKAAGPARG